MENSRKLSAAVLVLAACQPETPPVGADPAAADLWVKTACSACHGADGKGFAGLGPSIAGKQEHWSRESLVEYLDDPAAYAKRTERLGYFGKEMPAIASSVTPEERASIADYALWLMAQP